MADVPATLICFRNFHLPLLEIPEWYRKTDSDRFFPHRSLLTFPGQSRILLDAIHRTKSAVEKVSKFS